MPVLSDDIRSKLFTKSRYPGIPLGGIVQNKMNITKEDLYREKSIAEMRKKDIDEYISELEEAINHASESGS